MSLYMVVNPDGSHGGFLTIEDLERCFDAFWAAIPDSPARNTMFMGARTKAQFSRIIADAKRAWAREEREYRLWKRRFPHLTQRQFARMVIRA